MKVTFVSADTDPCLAAFTEEMHARGTKAERDESGPNMFKDPRIETMWEGFVCGWIMRGPRDDEAKRSVSQPGDILQKLAALTADASEDWKSRPREAALIALVQEAAGEIERLRATLRKIEMMDDGASSTYLGDIAREALKPQEAL